MATLAATYSYATDEVLLRLYLQQFTVDDSILELYYKAAIEIGDLYLDNPFQDESCVDVTHPTSIQIGLFEFVKNFCEQNENIVGGVGAIREGDVQITYGFNLIRDYFQSPLPPPVRRLWFPYKLGRRTDKDGKRVGTLMR